MENPLNCPADESEFYSFQCEKKTRIEKSIINADFSNALYYVSFISIISFFVCVWNIMIKTNSSWFIIVISSARKTAYKEKQVITKSKFQRLEILESFMGPYESTYQNIRKWQISVISNYHFWSIFSQYINFGIDPNKP